MRKSFILDDGVILDGKTLETLGEYTDGRFVPSVLLMERPPSYQKRVQVFADKNGPEPLTWNELLDAIRNMPKKARQQPVQLCTLADDDGPVQTDKQFNITSVILKPNRLHFPVAVLKERGAF